MDYAEQIMITHLMFQVVCKYGEKMGLLRKHRCDACDKSFKRIEELMQHKQVIHGRDSLYECKSCNMTFTNGEDFRAHARQRHSYKKK